MPTEGHLHLSHGRDCHRTEVPVTWIPPQPHLPPPVTLGKFFNTLQASLFSAAKVTGPHLGGGGDGGYEDHGVRPEEMVSEGALIICSLPPAYLSSSQPPQCYSVTQAPPWMCPWDCLLPFDLHLALSDPSPGPAR